MCKPFEENSDRGLDSQHEENVHLFPLMTPHCRKMKQCFWCPNKVCLKGYIAVQNFVGTAHSIPTSPVNKSRVCIEQHWPILVPCLKKDLTDLSSQQPTLSAFRDKNGSSYGLLVFFIWSEAPRCKVRNTHSCKASNTPSCKVSNTPSCVKFVTHLVVQWVTCSWCTVSCFGVFAQSMIPEELSSHIYIYIYIYVSVKVLQSWLQFKMVSMCSW